MNKNKAIIKVLFILLATGVSLILPKSIYAVSCASVPLAGNYSLTNSTCTFANTVDGVDNGTGSTNTAVLTVGSGGSLSILNGQTVATGSIQITGGGTITIINGAQIKLNTPLYLTDADGDGWVASTTTQFITGGAGKVRRSQASEFDANDAVACATGDQYSTCTGCTSGAPSSVASGSDTFSDCGAVACGATATTKYYSGWASNVCYYKADVASNSCDGAGACKTQAVACTAAGQGASTGTTRSTCQTQVGCTGTTIGSVGNVGSGSDTYTDCSQAYTCSGFATVLRNMCNGAGACAAIDSAATDCGGTCATYCSSGSCIATNTAAGTCSGAGAGTRVASGGTGHCTSSSCVADCTANGAACGSNAACCSGICRTDADGDGYYVGTTGTCRAADTTADCCDSDNRAWPGETTYYTTPRTTCGGYDFNCNGTEDGNNQSCNVCSCSSSGCALNVYKAACSNSPNYTCGQTMTCKNPTSWVGGVCTGTLTQCNAQISTTSPVVSCR